MNATDGDPEEKWVCQIMAAEGMFGFFGNLLVVFVILRVKFLHNMTNYLLVNLAVADMLVCIEASLYYLTSDCPIIALKSAIASNPAKELFCRFVTTKYLAFALSYATAYNLCLVTLERYIAIIQPLHYARKLTTTRMVTLVVVVWVISFIFPLPFLFTTDLDDDCKIKYPHWLFPFLVSTFSILVAYVMPLTMMSFAYFKMQATLKRQAAALKLKYARAAADDLVIARQNLVSTLKTVLGALIVLWTFDCLCIIPCLHRTSNSALEICGSDAYHYIRVLGNLLFNFNSVINPIIYEFKYKKFRQGLKVTFCSCFKKEDRNRVDILMEPM